MLIAQLKWLKMWILHLAHMLPASRLSFYDLWKIISKGGVAKVT